MAECNISYYIMVQAVDKNFELLYELTDIEEARDFLKQYLLEHDECVSGYVMRRTRQWIKNNIGITMISDIQTIVEDRYYMNKNGCIIEIPFDRYM